MNDLLNKSDRENLQRIMINYFLVDAIRSDYGDLNESLKHLDDVRQQISDLRNVEKKRVLAMNDSQLLHELVHARTSLTSEKSQE